MIGMPDTAQSKQIIFAYLWNKKNHWGHCKIQVLRQATLSFSCLSHLDTHDLLFLFVVLFIVHLALKFSIICIILSGQKVSLSVWDIVNVNNFADIKIAICKIHNYEKMSSKQAYIMVKNYSDFPLKICKFLQLKNYLEWLRSLEFPEGQQ